MRRKAILLALVGILVVLSGSLALAMSSTNYRLDWYVVLTGGGGGSSESAHYAANVTVGQTARGSSSSGNYAAGLGYWYGLDVRYTTYVPLLLRHAP